MILYIFILSTVLAFILILMISYGLGKTKRSLQILQQSGYDNKRFIKYFKTDFNDVFSLNELSLIVCLLILMKFNFYLGAFLFFFFIYYNQKFSFIRQSRFIKKKSLNYTSRVKRLIFTLIIINLVIFIIINSLFQSIITTLFIYLVLIINVTYINVLVANYLNLFNEKRIKNGFIKSAKTKLEKNSDTLVVGITGSYGKTSIKNIVGNVLNEVEPTLITPESFNTPMGLTITINNYLNPFHKNFIAEMGAYYKGEINELCQIVNPSIAIVSSVGPQHLETFKTIETITNTKMELVEYLNSDGLAILNFDNKYIREYKIKNDVKVWYYSLENKNADIYAFDIINVNEIQIFKVLFENKTYEVKTRLLGRHNVENILAALLVCIYKNIDIKVALDSISKLSPIKHRLEFKYVNEKLSILDDAFNSNPNGIKEAINILSSFENKKRIIITPGLIDLGSVSDEVHFEVGKLISEKLDEVYIVGSLNKEMLLKGIDNKIKVVCVDNFIDAYNKTISNDEQKVVLIANDLPDKFR